MTDEKITELAAKEPTEAHKSFAKFIFTEAGKKVPASTVALVQRLYPLYTKTDAVSSARAEAKAKRAADDVARKEKAEAKDRARLAAIEAQADKIKAKLGIQDKLDEPEAAVLTLVPVSEIEDETEAEAEVIEEEDVWDDGDEPSDEEDEDF